MWWESQMDCDYIHQRYKFDSSLIGERKVTKWMMAHNYWNIPWEAMFLRIGQITGSNWLIIGSTVPKNRIKTNSLYMIMSL